jgi:predicted O-methyltransferase YrrM
VIKKIYRFISPKFQTAFLDYKVNLQPRYGHGLPPHERLYKLIDEQRAAIRVWLEKAVSHRDVFQNIRDTNQEVNPERPAWNNGFLPGLDIILLYTIIAELKPRKYVEVGSGNSTKVAHLAKRNGELKTEIISIDPMPRAEIDQLATKVVRKPFEDVELNFFESLEAGDVVFIDNSHRILPNSDSTVFYLEVLPRLKPGVIVHIHDVYLPYDYPQFMCDRYYSEQYGLAMFMLANPSKYQTLLPNYFIDQDPELSAVLAPIWDHPNLENVERHGGSFWLEIK